ncbi:MAG TPA: methionine--tRNA ligase [Acholeplasmataceae bacterium]|nr:methionine--tRNA ligase [Acholeplasmataceae bacterium]
MKVYVTTPIYYSSGKVHIGNSYTTIACDVFARFHRLSGNDTFYLTGMDEHGQKVEEAAGKLGKDPQAYVDEIAESTKALWKRLHISNDDFIRTSEKRHVKIVQEIFEQLQKQDDIYLGEYEGNYCVACESFFTKSQLNENDTCPDCGKPTTVVKEEGYFLKLKKYEQDLLNYIYENPDFIQPESRKNEVIAFIKQGLEDLCVSRTSFSWGVPVLSNPKHVVYVWIDALSNYLTALGYKTTNDEKYQKYWVNGDEVVHVVGKDILRFHAIYWPIMLMALKVPIKFKLYAHGWVLMKEGKMSKSKGNVIYPDDVISRYGVDPLRLYLVSEMPLGNDAIFTYERFVERYNTLLANDLGNLVSRTITMINKYFDGNVYKPKQNYFDVDESIEKMIEEVKEKYLEYFSNFQFQNGVNEIWKLISRANKYIDETTPWILAKDENKKEELNSVLYHLFEVLRVVAIMINPIMPSTSDIIFEELGVNKESQNIDSLQYGLTETSKVVEKPIVLFKRLKWEEEMNKYD